MDALRVKTLLGTKRGRVQAVCIIGQSAPATPQQEDENLLRKFWELEADIELTKEQRFTDEEKKCEEIFTSTTTRDKDSRYIVRLPFKHIDPECTKGESRMIAVKYLNCLLNKFGKNEKFKEHYKAVIKEYVELRHMEEIKNAEDIKRKSVYLPHHAVIRDDKDTTKIRVVFNASQKNLNGISLNDTLMIGPTIQPDLRHLVLRWRLHSICLTADIVKMYRQVKVHEEDANYQRIVWKEEHNDEIKDYKLQTVTFGTASAPFLAVRSLHQLAYDEGKKFPDASERVLKDFYMDDLMTGCETVSEGVKIYNQMNDLLGKGKFTLQKWSSNDKELLEILKKEEEV